MNKITQLTPHFAVTGALQPADFAEIAAAGFKSILSNLPDGELAAYPTSAAGGGAGGARGARLPPRPHHQGRSVFSDRVVDGVGDALRELPGPVLAHCASGMRSAVAWAAAASRGQPVDRVLAVLQAAGFNLDAVRDELEEPARSRATQPHPAGAGCALRRARLTSEGQTPLTASAGSRGAAAAAARARTRDWP